MKILLWIGFCVMCGFAGHPILGAIALALLLGCLPVRPEPEYGTADEKTFRQLI